jgi:hypothetical protein
MGGQGSQKNETEFFSQMSEDNGCLLRKNCLNDSHAEFLQQLRCATIPFLVNPYQESEGER